MPSIHLGVIELPYSHSIDLGKSKSSGKEITSSTGQVAEILESKYKVMQTFFKLHEEEIIHELEDALQGSFESLLMGAPPPSNPFAAGTEKVEELFQRFLSNKEMDGLADGVPTKASLDGISHRFKSGKGPKPRPSFIDTGLYQSSFKCWAG